MIITQEDIVTRLLSVNEILRMDNAIEPDDYPFKTNPAYDLTHFLNTIENEPSRFGEKYIFVK